MVLLCVYHKYSLRLDLCPNLDVSFKVASRICTGLVTLLTLYAGSVTNS